MAIQNQFSKYLVTLVFLAALMLPYAVQFSHLFEEHEHTSCSEQKTHIHKSIVDCEICGFQLTTLHFDVAEFPDLEVLTISNDNNSSLSNSKLHSFKITNTRLRAPPAFS